MQQYDIENLKAIYDRDGVVKVPQLVSAEWVARILDCLDTFMEKDPGEGNTVNFGHGPGRRTVRWMYREVPEIVQFAAESGIAPTIGGIIGARSLKLWYDNTFIQEGGFSGADLAGSPYHSDMSVFPFTGEQNPSVWVALTNVNEDTAPLTCLKGTHKTGVRYRPPVYKREGVPLPPGFCEQPDWDAAIEAGEWETVWYSMAPGDTLVIHPDVIHGAPPAADNAPKRIGFTSRWAGDDIRWKKHGFAMDIPGIDYADIVDGTMIEGEYFPEVWRA